MSVDDKDELFVFQYMLEITKQIVIIEYIRIKFSIEIHLSRVLLILVINLNKTNTGTWDMEAEDLQGLCNRILESDRNIRFVGISNKMGNQIISRYRSGLTPLLTQQ